LLKLGGNPTECAKVPLEFRMYKNPFFPDVTEGQVAKIISALPSPSKSTTIGSVANKNGSALLMTKGQLPR
jgi:hypothetical protein